MTAVYAWLKRWDLLILLWLAFFLNQADRQIFSIVMPLIKAELQLSDTQLGLIASALVFTYGLCVPIAGFSGDWFSKRNIVGFSLIFWSLATVSTGLCYTVFQFVLLRGIATGGGEAFYAPSANAMIGARYPQQKSFALSIHQSAVYFGIILSGLLVGYLAERYGWRNAFYVFGGAGVIVGLVFLWRIPREAATTQTDNLSIGRALALFFRTPTVILLTLAFACMVFVNVAYLTWMPTLLVEKFALGITHAGFSSMFYHHVGAFVGVMAAGYFSDRWSRRRPVSRLYVQGAALLIAAPFVYLTGTAPSLELTCLFLALFGVFRGVYDANIFASLFEVVPQAYRSSLSGIMLMFAFMVGAGSPSLIGVLKSSMSFSQAFASLSIAYLIGSLCLGWAATKYFSIDYLKTKTI